VIGDIHRWLLAHLAGMDDRSLWILLLVVIAVIVLRARLPPSSAAPEEAARSRTGRAGG
jgi:hypothetical protein